MARGRHERIGDRRSARWSAPQARCNARPARSRNSSRAPTSAQLAISVTGRSTSIAALRLTYFSGMTCGRNAMREPCQIRATPNGNASVRANSHPSGPASTVLSQLIAATARMRRRRDEDQTGGALRKIECESQRQRAAPRMADEDCAIDAEPVEHVAQHLCLVRRRTALAGLARAETEPGPIDQDDAMTRGKTLAERKVHVFEIGSGAVQEDDWRRALRIAAGWELDDVLTKTADIDERPRGRCVRSITRAPMTVTTAPAQRTATTMTSVVIGPIVRGDYARNVTCRAPIMLHHRASARRGRKADRVPAPRSRACRF